METGISQDKRKGKTIGKTRVNLHADIVVATSNVPTDFVKKHVLKRLVAMFGAPFLLSSVNPNVEISPLNPPNCKLPNGSDQLRMYGTGENSETETKKSNLSILKKLVTL